MDALTLVSLLIAAIAAFGLAHSVAGSGALESLHRHEREPVHDLWMERLKTER